MATNRAPAPEQTTAEILVVGNELLNGTTLDTNSHWFCTRLDSFGVKVQRKTTIRDELETISKTFRECISRKPDWLISVGGLGPTFDDMTIEGLAISLHRKLVLDDRAVSMLKASYARRASMKIRKMSRSRLKMATIPENSTPLFNPVGSAPAVLVEYRRTKIVALPGVPKEMKAIFDQEIVPMLKRSINYLISERWLKIVGISESVLAPRINRIAHAHSPSIYIKSHPKGFEQGKSVLNIQLRATSARGDAKKVETDLEKATLEVISSARSLGARVKSI